MNHEPFMSAALKEARKALSAGEFPVGCVIAYEGSILATGSRLNSASDKQNELDHAEMSALRKLVDLGQEIESDKLILYSTLEPCLMCYSAMMLNGMRRVVYAYEDVMGGGTNINLKGLNPLYSELDIKVTPHVMREDSLALVKEFFSDPRNSYLRDTPLAIYTLSQ